MWRKVYNLALAARTQAWMLRREQVNCDAMSVVLTVWKKTGGLAHLTRWLTVQ